MTADYVIVGSGVNALVAAALLGKKGKKVLVLERNDRIGGCIRTEEIAPGFTCDVMATTFVLFVTSPAYGALAGDLAARGLEFAHSPFPTGVLLPDGRHQIFTMDRARNIAAFDTLAAGDGARYGAEMRQARRRCALSVLAARRLAMVLEHGEDRRARGLDARAAQPCRLLR